MILRIGTGAGSVGLHSGDKSGGVRLVGQTIHPDTQLSRKIAINQRFRIELRKKVRVGRLVKVLSIFRHATEGTANSHGFFEGGTESAAPFEGSTSRKIAMRIPGASRSIGRGGAGNLRATCRQEPLHCRVRPR